MASPALSSGAFKLTLVTAILVVSLATGEGMDVGALFLPVGIVAVLTISPPTFAAVVARYRACLFLAGVTTALLAFIGIAGDPTIERAVLATLFLIIGTLTAVAALSSPVAALLPWTLPKRTG